MLTGLIIGKFMPLTKGHIGLIDFAIQNSDTLIVAVCTLKGEPIDGDLRYNWVKDYYGTNEKVKVVHITQELPNSSKSISVVSKTWADYLKVAFPMVNVIFASEEYGKHLAQHMNAEYKPFDADRKAIPISATKVRNDPFKYWDFIPEIVKPYFIKKICIYGPDSYDKSILTSSLAKHYKTALVPKNSIGMFQFTDEIKKCQDIKYDLYLLLDIDTPYLEDGQLSFPDKKSINCVLLSGSWKDRFNTAVHAIDNKFFKT